MYERYEALRAKKNLTNYAVSKATGVSQSVLSNWKTGKHEPVVETLQALADFFCVSLDFLLGRASLPDRTTEAESPAELSLEDQIEQVLSGLSDSKSGTLMLDGKPASPEAVESLKSAILFGIEYARKVNSQKREGKDSGY